MSIRALTRIPVPPGAEGVRRLWAHLGAALDGIGPALAPVPVVSPTISNDYVTSILTALRPDDHAHPLESEEVAAVIATSGSTGAPRGVLLTSAQLTSMNYAVNGSGTPQWIAALPVTSMGGFNVLVRARAAGREPVIVPTIGGAGPFTVADFADAVEEAARIDQDVRVSIVPAQLARLLSEPRGVEALLACRLILVGAAATRPALRGQAADLGIAITTTYGATETAGGCVFDGRPLPGVRVTSDGDPGVLTIEGPCVALGYRGEPELTARTFPGGAFRTSDLGTVSPDGTVTVIGRADEVIVIRGVNVSPAAVEQVIAQRADVQACAVVVSESDGEPRLHAFIQGEAPDAEALRDDVVRRLGVAARPIVHPVPELPYLPNGKVDRRALIARADEIAREEGH